MVAENSNDRKLQGTEFDFTNLAADICLPKIVAELLSHLKWQFYPPENNRHSSFLYYEIPGDTLLTKMPAELPSTEQIFTESSRFVPLYCSFKQVNMIILSPNLLIIL